MNFMNEDWCILMKYVAQREYITRESSVILCYPSSISHLRLFAYVMRKGTKEEEEEEKKIETRKSRDSEATL